MKKKGKKKRFQQVEREADLIGCSSTWHLAVLNDGTRPFCFVDYQRITITALQLQLFVRRLQGIAGDEHSECVEEKNKLTSA